MAEFSLNQSQRSRLIEIMTRHGRLDNENERQNFLMMTDYGDELPDLQSDLPITSSSKVFSETLLRFLLKQGRLPNSRRHALDPLLRYLCEQISGRESDLVFLKELLETLDQWVNKSDAPQPIAKPTLSEDEQKHAYDEAVLLFGQNQWVEVLKRVTQLEEHRFTQDTVIPLGVIKEQASVEKEKAEHLADMRHEYERIVVLTQMPDIKALAVQKWLLFLEKYEAEFTIQDDPKDLRHYFEVIQCLTDMQNRVLPETQRVFAGRRLAQIGDPRPEVMDVDNMEFCWVPEGRFWMGCDESDEMCDDCERPANWFNIPFGYWIGKYPVTNSQYNVFVNESGYQNEQWWELAKSAGFWRGGEFIGGYDKQLRTAPSNFGESFNLPNHPVVGVSWFEAIAYIEWLKIRWKNYLPKGWIVTLPTEPLWEKAARGGELILSQPFIREVKKGLHSPRSKLAMVPNQNIRRRYTWGDELTPELANFYDTGINSTSAIGCFFSDESPYGCAELHGNVMEWSRSEPREYPYNFHESDISEENIETYNKGVLRGGAFNRDKEDLRCASRDEGDLEVPGWNLGFRLTVVALQRD